MPISFSSGSAVYRPVGPLSPTQRLWELAAATENIKEAARKETTIAGLEKYKAQLEALVGTAKDAVTTTPDRVKSVVAPGVVDAKQNAASLAEAAKINTFYDTPETYNTGVDPRVQATWDAAGKKSSAGYNTAMSMYDTLFDIEQKIKKQTEAQTKYAATRNVAPEQKIETGVFQTNPLDQTTPLVSGGNIAAGTERMKFIRDMQSMVSDAKKRSAYVPVFGYY